VNKMLRKWEICWVLNVLWDFECIPNN